MKLRIVKCKKPKGYICSKFYFPNTDSANQFTNNLNQEFLLNKTRQLEHPNLSKRKRKNLMFSRPKKYLLTKIGSKYLLWEKLN